VTDYILEEPATCPSCRHDVLEKTLIEPAWLPGSLVSGYTSPALS